MQAQKRDDQWQRLAAAIAKIKGAYLGTRLSADAVAMLDKEADADLVKARLRWAVAAERVAYDNPGIAIASQEPLPMAAE